MSPSATQYQQHSLRTRALLSSLSFLPLPNDRQFLRGVFDEHRLVDTPTTIQFVLFFVKIHSHSHGGQDKRAKATKFAKMFTHNRKGGRLT